MADPTQPLRDSLGNIISNLIPENSPLSQSGQSAAVPQPQREPAVVDQVVPTEQIPSAPTEAPANYVAQAKPQQATPVIPQVAPINTSGIEKVANQEALNVDKATEIADQEALKIERQRVKKEEEFVQKEAEAKDKLNKAEQAVKDFTFDNRSLWDKSSTGQKIVLAISAFLSSASNQGAQAFRDSIKNSVDQDLAAQREKLLTLKEGAKTQESLLGQMRNQFANDKEAMLAAESLVYRKMGNKLSAIAQSSQSKMMAEKAKIGAQEAYNASVIAQQKLVSERQKVSAKPLSAEAQQRYDNAAMALKGVQEMRKALKAGQNTFSVVGDNEFTLGSQNFVEGLGRMQSGGAIGAEEQKRFENMRPKATDSAAIQMKKLDQAEKELRDRINALKPAETTQDYFKAK